MFKQLSLSKFIILAVTVACLLSPAALAAMSFEPAPSSDSKSELAQSGNASTMYSSYNFDNSGPSNCPFPQRFRADTRRVYSYAPVEFVRDVQAAILWYELDNEGNFISNDPFAVSTFFAAEGTFFPYGFLSFNSNVSGNVAVFLVSDSGSGFVTEAVGAYRIVSSEESAPEPGSCPL